VDRVFLDANVLFSAAYRQGTGLLRLWQLTDVELITSAFAANEAVSNLSTDIQRERLDDLLARMIIVATAPNHLLPPEVSLPEKDVPILLAAIQAGASHLLTGDKQHFGPLFDKTIGGVFVQPPAAYLATRKTP
jgi:predicted nucleic acid-binding protein